MTTSPGSTPVKYSNIIIRNYLGGLNNRQEGRILDTCPSPPTRLVPDYCDVSNHVAAENGTTTMGWISRGPGLIRGQEYIYEFVCGPTVVKNDELYGLLQLNLVVKVVPTFFSSTIEASAWATCEREKREWHSNEMGDCVIELWKTGYTDDKSWKLLINVDYAQTVRLFNDVVFLLCLEYY